MVCQNCKSENNFSAKFCEHCGNLIRNNVNSLAKPKKNFIKALKTSLGLALLGATASCVYQTTFLKKLGIDIPLELYGEIFGQFIAYGIMATPIIYIFFKFFKS